MTKEIICGIYKITSPSGKVYIGQSENIHKRWRVYKRLNCAQQVKIYNSLNKHGAKNHTFEIVEECIKQELNCYERHWQDFYEVINPEKGLNLKLTECDDKIVVFSDETRLKMSEAMIGNKRGLGMKHSQELKEEIAERMKGNKHGLGTKRTEESKKKISEVMKGNKNSLGYTHSNEMKQGISKRMVGNTNGAGNKGKRGFRHSLDAIERMSASRSKIILNNETGIFYTGVAEAALTINMNVNTLRSKLCGFYKNNTPFIYV